MRKFRINIIDVRASFLKKERFVELDAVKLNYNGSDSRFDTIMSSEFSFSLDNETGVDGRYLDLFGGDERRHRVEIEELIGSTAKLIWQGYLLPDVYSEPYINVRFFVKFTATDGLGALKNKPFTLYKTNTVIKIISRCLFETGLQQPIYFAPGIVNPNKGWSEIQIFEEYFNELRNDGSLNRTNCYDVLEKMLKAVGATVFTHGGIWYIVGFNRKHLVTDKFLVYDAFGGFVRNQLVYRNVTEGVFTAGLNVVMAQPYRLVQLNVAYKRSDDVIFKTEYLGNPDLNTQEIESAINNVTVRNKFPLVHWSQSGNAKKMLGTIDGKTSLQVASESVSGDFPVHPAGTNPQWELTPPGYVRVLNPTTGVTNWNNDYIEIKDSNALYLSPQRDGKPQEFTFEADLKAYPYVDEEKYNEGFYQQIFRVEIHIGNELLFTTRGEVTGYNSADYTVKFIKGSSGPIYRWYEAPNYLQPAGSAKRWSIPNVLQCEIKDIKRSSYASGPLKVRLYVPRNKDNAKTLDGKHILHVLMSKFEVSVNDWDDENFEKRRNVSSSNVYQSDLPFSDGKSDLYTNLFKLGERADYLFGMAPNDILATGYTSSDAVNYYITWPSNVSGGIVERIKNNYSTIKIGRDNEMVFLYQIFGDLSPESGCYINDTGSFTINKARIEEFPQWRDLLRNVNRLTAPQITMPTLLEDSPRSQYVEWKRSNNNQTGRYLDQYAKMIHDCQSVVSPRLDGELLKVVSPLDLVRFNFLGEKNFFPTRLTIDFSTGKSQVFLLEANLNTVEDYVN